MMSLILNLIILLFSAALTRSDENVKPLITVKISGNVTYDCVDIYKQPGFDHPLLQNHTIQMKPSLSIPQVKSQVGYNKTYEKEIGCPVGTVPILRHSKQYNSKYVHPLTADKPGAHISGVKSNDGIHHGVEAVFSGYNVNVGKDQASYNQMYVGDIVNNHVNFISTGWMINPSQFPDGRVWKYGFWEGKDGKGCYNTACAGFIQVSHDVAIVGPIDLKPGVPGWSCMSIHQDKTTGNWWLTQLNDHAPNVDIGYWPKELFTLFDSGAKTVGFGGAVQASPSGGSPPMGNGKFPTKNREETAIFSHIKVYDAAYIKRSIFAFTIEQSLDSPKCYGLKAGRKAKFYQLPELFFNYGGPGGNSCGN